jgi:hypothetical protein
VSYSFSEGINKTVSQLPIILGKIRMAQPIGATAAHTTSSMLFEGLFFNVAEVAIAHKNVLKMTVIPIKKLIKSGYKLDIKYKCLNNPLVS